MAEGTRLRSMEKSIRKTESQLLELQQFMNSNREFMNSTKNFIEESRAQHEEHRLAIAEQGKKTESQFTQITEMFRSLMEKGTSLPANPSIQSMEGILAPNPVEDSTPEIVTSKIEHVQEESFVDEYKLFDEMPMEDESEILQENCSADLTNASAKVFPPSLTQSVVANEAVECDDITVDSKEMKTDKLDSLFSSVFVEYDYASFSIPNDTLSLGIFNLPSPFSATYGGSKQFEVVVLELILVNANELFEKMSKKDVVDFDDFVELPSILGDLLVSIDFPSSYVFDPGTSTAFSFHIERSAKKLNYGVLQDTANSHVEGVLRETCRGSSVFVFDPGKGLQLWSHIEPLLVFDPGGLLVHVTELLLIFCAELPIVGALLNFAELPIGGVAEFWSFVLLMCWLQLRNAQG